MKTRTINIYTHEDLILPENEAVKERVLTHMRETDEFWQGEEALESLKKGIEYFGGSLRDYDISWYMAKYATFQIDPPEEITREQVENAGTYNPETLKGDGECKFTGVCYDEDFLDGVRKAVFNGEENPKEILLSGCRSWAKAIQEEYEYTQTEEAILENIFCNEYEFLESGKMA